MTSCKSCHKTVEALCVPVSEFWRKSSEKCQPTRVASKLQKTQGQAEAEFQHGLAGAMTAGQNAAVIFTAPQKLIRPRARS
jgi:hypothetical protein